MIERLFICANPDCDFHKEEEFLSKQRNCPDCERPLVEKTKENNLSDEERDIINKYPYVIAYPFYKYLNEKDLHSKISLLKDVFEGTLRYLALLTLSEYFKSNLKSTIINESYNDNIKTKQTIGNLIHFISESLMELKKHNHYFFIPALLDFYEVSINKKGKNLKKRTIVVSEGVTDEYGNKHNLTETKTEIDILRDEFRNKMIGHGVTWPASVNKKILNDYVPIVLEFLKTVSFVKNYPMFKWEKGGTYKLMSYQVKNDPAETRIPDNKELLWIRDSQENTMTLAPLFVLPNKYVADVKKHTQLFFYLDFTGTVLALLSPENEIGLTSGKIVQLLNHTIAEKQINSEFLKADTITYKDFLNNLKETERDTKRELYRYNPYIDTLYQKREEAEMVLKSFVQTSYGLFLVAAQAGSGKTTLLNAIRKELIAQANRFKKSKKKAESLFLLAKNFTSTNVESEIKLSLKLSEDFDLNFLKTGFGYSQSEPFIILIDGGNEHSNPELLITEIMRFIKKHSGGFIKIILTWRVDLKSELPIVDNEFAQYIYSEKDDKSNQYVLQKKAYLLTPFNNVELEQAWGKYAKNKSKKYSPCFSFEELTIFDRKLVNELKTPLHLKLFLELYHQNNLPEFKGIFNFWQEWVFQFKSNNEYELLLSLVSLMFRHKMHRVPSQIYFLDLEFQKYLNYNITGPFNQLILKGVLTETNINNERYLSFTLEAFYHYMLGVFLQGKYENAPPYFLLQLIKKDCLKGIEKGVQHILINDINKKKYDSLNWLIDNSDEKSLQWFAFPLAHAFEKHAVKEIFDCLFKSQTINDIIVLYKTINLLEETLQINLIKKVLLMAEKLITVNSFESILIKIEAVKFQKYSERILNCERILKNISQFDFIEKNKAKCFYKLGQVYEFLSMYEKAITCYENSLIIRKKIFGEEHFEYTESAAAIGNIHFNTGNYDESLKYHQKCLSVSLKIFGEEHTDTASSYNNIALVHAAKNNNEKALSLHQKSIDISLKFLGDFHPEMCPFYNNIAQVYGNLGDFKNALKYYQKAISTQLLLSDSDNPDLAFYYNNIGIFFGAQEKYEDALCYCEKAYKIFLKVFGKKNRKTELACGDLVFYNIKLGHKYYEDNNFEESLKYYHNSLSFDLKLYKKENSRHKLILNFLGNAYFCNKNYKEALKYYQKKLEMQLKDSDSKQIDTLEDYLNISITARNLDNHELNIKYLKLWWENTDERMGGPAHEMHDCYKELNQPKEALHWLEQTALIRKERLGDNDERTKNTIKELLEYAKELNDKDLLKKWSANNLN